MNAIAPNPWWDWLLCDSRTLQKRGLDPRERLTKTGHERALSPHWAKSIGMWCRADPQTIMSTVFPRSSTDQVRASYDIFKYRHRLFVKSKFMKIHMREPSRAVFMQVGAVMVATVAHSRVWGHMLQDETQTMSVGAAAKQSCLYWPETPEERNTRVRARLERQEDPLGILPVEALLYYYAIEHILQESSITYAEWNADKSGQGSLDRAEHWKIHDADSIVSLPQIALTRYLTDDA